MTNSATITVGTEQFYVFAGPDGWAWVEMFLAGGIHEVAPTPHRHLEGARIAIAAVNPEAVVDYLWYPDEIADAQALAAARIGA